MPHQEIVHLVDASVAIVALILLISWARLHAFVALVLVSVVLAIACGLSLSQIVHSFEAGVGGTLGHAAVVIALGSMLGKMLAESGGAGQIARTLLAVFGKNVSWAMLAMGIIIGLPVFFEVGFLLLIPIAYQVAQRTGRHLVAVALPMTAGLSVVHALIPPHPAAIFAVNAYQANLGRTVAFALLLGVPAAVLAGPVYAAWIVPKLRVKPVNFETNPVAAQFLHEGVEMQPPSFALAMGTVLLPVVLMMLGGWSDRLAAPGSLGNGLLKLIGSGDIALLIGVLVSFVTFGFMQGLRKERIEQLASLSLMPSVGAMLLIGAGGGFGRVLQDTGIAAAAMHLAERGHLPLVLTAWMFAALIRVATGSATVAMTTAASVIAPMALHIPGSRPELLAIATGAGSIVLSHVNDGGFWLVQEYLHLSVPQTIATWTACETILSVAVLGGVLVAAAL